MLRLFLLFLSTSVAVLHAENWSQGPGPSYDYTGAGSEVPSYWSVARNENIVWRTALPETGQSTPIIWQNHLFLSTMKPVDEDAALGSDIVAYAISADDGNILWERAIPGGYQTRLSGPFADASAPPPVTDGTHVWFVNPAGRVSCFDFEGTEIWSRELTSCARTQPVLFEGMLIFHHQVYLPDGEGHFTHEHEDAPIEEWTQLQALDARTGERVWLSRCGVNMGCNPIVQRLNDGSPVMIVGRGGGHSPPEKPDGISMIRADTGKTLWSLPLTDYMATQTFPLDNDQALIFHKGDHLWVDALTGEIERRVSIVNDVDVRRWSEEGHRTVVESLAGKKPRSITQGSNLKVGNYHYFRSYTRNYLGRVAIDSGRVDYLELPLQVLREPGKPDELLWNEEYRKADLAPLEEKKFRNNISYTSLRHNTMVNSRGFVVSGDNRDIGNGWGHTASPYATAVGNRIFIPILCGMVFVLDGESKSLDESAILAISDLGPLGNAQTRASISTDGQRLYGRTIREVVAIGMD